MSEIARTPHIAIIGFEFPYGTFVFLICFKPQLLVNLHTCSCCGGCCGGNGGGVAAIVLQLRWWDGCASWLHWWLCNGCYYCQCMCVWCCYIGFVQHPQFFLNPTSWPPRDAGVRPPTMLEATTTMCNDGVAFDAICRSTIGVVLIWTPLRNIAIRCYRNIQKFAYIVANQTKRISMLHVGGPLTHTHTRACKIMECVHACTIVII